MKRMIDDSKIKVNNNGEVEINANVVVNGEMSFPDGEQSTKKIYCHPISIRDSGVETNKCRITALIFNNDPTPFTWTSFKKWIDDLQEATEGKGRLMISGGYATTTMSIICSYFVKTNTNYYYVVGLATDGSNASFGGTTWETTFPSTYVFEDGVNAIN